VGGVSKTSRWVAKQVRKHVIGFDDELWRWLVEATTQVLHSKRHVRASGRSRIHEATDAFLHWFDELRVCAWCSRECIGHVEEEVG